MAAASIGTATILTYARPSHTFPVGLLRLEWTSNATGKVTKVLDEEIGGFILRTVTNPDGTSVPTSGHLVTLLDDDSVDVLGTLGALSSSATVSHYKNFSATITGGVQMPCRGIHTLTITGAGAAKKGVLGIYFGG